MTETEYKLLNELAKILDLADDCQDYIDDVSMQICTLREEASKIFFEVRDENLDEWTSMQKAEANIIESKYLIKSKGESNA